VPCRSESPGPKWLQQVNDVYGHGVGDQVLTIIAQRVLGAMRDGDLAARLGGDEFAILALHLVGPEAATSVALRVIEALKEPITAGSVRHQIGAGNVGNNDLNQALSEHRAGSVRDYLVESGVNSNAVTAQGYGNTQPVATNDNSTGRQQNRRVELAVSGDIIGTLSTKQPAVFARHTGNGRSTL
jgi:hypothetical protein